MPGLKQMPMLEVFLTWQPFMLLVLQAGIWLFAKVGQAGPPGQGGYCVLAGNFPVNTQVKITEAFKPPFFPISITVNEGQLISCLPQFYCAIATIIPGITEVTYTNIEPQGKTIRCLECEKYQ